MHALIVGGIVPDKPEILYRLFAGILEPGGDGLAPLCPRALGLPEGVPVAAEVGEGILQAGIQPAASPIKAPLKEGRGCQKTARMIRGTVIVQGVSLA